MKESRGITPLRTILQNCLNHIENLETNRSKTDNYDKEFQDLKQFSETLKTQKEYSCTEGEKEVNRKKNRYKDILPFNISRVVLSEYSGIPGSDYINANYIKGASGSPAYIASQGPLPNTVNDFWRMVVECEVQVIVMACNAQESGKEFIKLCGNFWLQHLVRREAIEIMHHSENFKKELSYKFLNIGAEHKCENYWVEKEGEEKRFGMVQICLVKASIVCPDFLVRTMRLKYTNDKDVTEERTVCQFHYSAWPDHGVPPLVRPLLDMVRLVRDTQASETLPVLVHCSAGCGRTGTICAIDFVWGLLRAGKLTEEFSLFNLVKDMRKQRVAMVQTKEQYILVHQVVRELFKEQLRVIESHPYENIDFNGVPLIKDFEEPFYDTISLEKDENCDEKQDKSEVKNKGDDGENRLSKTDTAPPLPRKKRPNVLFSKQEKEAENLTEKNRTSFVENEKEKMDASLSSLLGKPRIVKLRALFEKSPITKERILKDKGSQTVSRSHSLGAIRKPLLTEVFDSSAEKNKSSTPQTQSVSDSGKLKHSKSFSRSVPLIKRSKSLKSFSQSPHLCLSSSNTVILKNYQQKPYDEENFTMESISEKLTANCDISQISGLSKECSKRRRSLESLMGEVPPSVSWRGFIEPNNIDLKKRQKSLDWSPKLNSSSTSSSKTTDILKHQLQRLSLETEKKINTFVTGIGIRERRNSFRQAVSKSDSQTKKVLKKSQMAHRDDVHLKSNQTQTIDQPDGAFYDQLKTRNLHDGRKFKMHEKFSEGVKKVTRPLQQSSISSQAFLEPRKCKSILISKNRVEEPELKNRFLRKLNSEIYESQRENANHNSHAIKSRLSYEESDLAKNCNPVLGGSDSKKFLFRTNVSIKSTGSYAISSNIDNDVRPTEIESEVFQLSNRQNGSFQSIQKPSQTYECFKCHTTSPASHTRPALSHKNAPYQNSVTEGNSVEDIRPKEQFASSKVHENEVTFSSYRKNPTSNLDLYVKIISEPDGNDKKMMLPPKVTVGKIGKTYEHVSWGHPASSRSSGDVSSSEQSSDSSRLIQYETENPVMVKKPEQTKTRLEEPIKIISSSEQPIGQKKADELKTKSSVEFCNYGIVGTSKSRQTVLEYSKDDFLLKEPTAPPRIKRHASVMVPRNILNGSDHVSPWVGIESKLAGVRSATLQADKSAWNGTIGVDLDAIAASMQQDKKELSSVLKDGVWFVKNPLNATASSNIKKKQHYF